MTIVLPLRTRRVRRRRVLSGAGHPPEITCVPRVARMLALAHHWRGLVRSGVVRDQAALAALVGVSRARVTQVMDLLRLAPDVQEQVLASSDLGSLRHCDLLPLAAEPVWSEQRRIWRRMRPA